MMETTGRIRFLIAVMLLCNLSLSGTTYRSNSIGMRFEQLAPQASLESGYILVVEENPVSSSVEQSLYHDGQLVEKTMITSSLPPAQRKTIVNTTYDIEGREIERIRQVFEGLQPINLTRTSEYGTWMTMYTYENGKLIAQRNIKPDNQEQLFVYYRDSRDGSLVGVRVSQPNGPESIRYYSIVEGTDIYAEGDETDFAISKIISDGILVRETWAAGDAVQSAQVDYDASGNLIVDNNTPDGLVRSTYGKAGVLLDEKWMSGPSSGMEITYAYDTQGILEVSRKSMPKPNQRIIEDRFVHGILVSTTEWDEGVLVRTVEYPPKGGTVVTLYDKGKPYADVTYAPDGKRVLSLTYREGL